MGEEGDEGSEAGEPWEDGYQFKYILKTSQSKSVEWKQRLTIVDLFVPIRVRLTPGSLLSLAGYYVCSGTVQGLGCHEWGRATAVPNVCTSCDLAASISMANLHSRRRRSSMAR